MEKAGSTQQQEGKGASPSFRADPTPQDHQHRTITQQHQPPPTAQTSRLSF